MKWLKNLFKKKEVKKQDKTTKSYGVPEFKRIPSPPPSQIIKEGCDVRSRTTYQTVDSHNDLLDPTNIISPLNPFSPISVWDHPNHNYSSPHFNQCEPPSYDSTSSQDYSSSDYSSSDYTSSYSTDSTSYDSDSSSYSCD